MPKLPAYFDCHVEANINNRNFTTDFHLFYNKGMNVAATYSVTAGVHKQNLYNFTSQQYLSTDLDRSQYMVLLHGCSNIT